MRNHYALATAILFLISFHSLADEASWKPNEKCAVVKRNHEGLTPKAYRALVEIEAEHRITQTINLNSDAANYHGRDQILDGKNVTAAVDISVRCLNDLAIKQLLSELANKGFAAWYRNNGKDSWKGAAHIHAVFAEEPLKRQLKGQVASWLRGNNGLVGDATYEFWQPTDQQRAKVRAMYEASMLQSNTRQ